MATLPRPLAGVRVLSLALNLPGPAALLRCARLGATCTKVEPPTGDPMAHYDRGAYAALHDGVQVRTADLKAPEGQAAVHAELARTDVLLTSFRPSALKKLGLDWTTLHTRYPSLCQVAIVGGPGPGAEVPGHDLTYLAEHGLVTGTALPATLFADMGGALMATEAVLQAALLQAQAGSGSGAASRDGRYFEVALSDAAGWLALPRHWGLTRAEGAVGGAHAGYRVYPCADGRVAVAALEPHFARALLQAAGLPAEDPRAPLAPATHQALQAWFARHTRAQLDALAQAHDLPLHTMA